MIRNLFRKIDKEYNGKVSFFIASVGAGLDTDVFDEIFKKANDEAPSVLVFEDIESLTKDSMITRSEFLNKLDGINVEGNGVLVIGTTNNPADVDNALIQRPSRFDRVWYFKLPDEKLRLEYLKMNFKGIEECNLIRVAKETSDWNFSYLNELRTSSALLSISDHQNEVISNETFLKAFELLKKQFELCKNKENILDEGEGKKKLGFAGL
jgi:SpoVK/Ycf46/Vps4 family AAA+-type ATPase